MHQHIDASRNRVRAHAYSYNTTYILLISCTAALGGLLFGYDWVVIGGAKPFYEQYFQLRSEEEIGWANSSALVGCLLGSLVCGVITDRFGRKRPLILAAFLFVISSLYTGWALTFRSFIAWRIVGGVAIGIASNLSPLYIAEVSPALLRGRLVTLNQFAIVVGILAAQMANWLIAEPVPRTFSTDMIRLSWNGQEGWRWMFIATAVPSIILLLCSLAIPESPRWMAKCHQMEKARRTLARIGGDKYANDVVEEIRTALATEALVRGSWKELRAPKMRRLLTIGIALAVLQQWSGINVIFNYSDEIFRDAGYGISGTLTNIAITGTLNLVFTLVALTCVDLVGRRALMLFGCGGIAASHVMFGVAYAIGARGVPLLLLTLCTIGFYALSLAPVTWVLISEIFPNGIRSFATSACISSLWIACFILTYTFPMLNHRLGPSWTFWAYGLICVTGFIFVLLYVPETKGKTLEGIERDLGLPESMRDGVGGRPAG